MLRAVGLIGLIGLIRLIGLIGLRVRGEGLGLGFRV